MSRPRVSLLMAMHCHQPVGNFDFVFERAYQQAYEPFLAVLERHPGIRLALHYSGSLLDWLIAKRPDFIRRLKRLVRDGRVELLSSGYYEPILSMIPEADRQGQLALMRQRLQRHFGAKSQGAWLTERVWEPELARSLARAGVGYTLLDGNQFHGSRALLPSRLQFENEDGWDLLGSYQTAYEQDAVRVFPTSKRLRYWMPFQEPERTIDWLRRLSSAGPVAVTYGDDGEKFGLWPNTHAWVYEHGWLERFFAALERESEWLATSTFQDYAAQHEPDGRIYLPCGSYEEMLQWSGGYFRNFFVKYPESRAMAHKALRLSRRLGELERSLDAVRDAAKRRRLTQALDAARDHLYQGQCNDAYWHGVFGGLYLGHLRRAVYQHLLAAEETLEQVRPSGERQIDDADGDGQPEIILRSSELAITVSPREHGAITELDVRRRGVNLLDVLARRPEPYHEKLRNGQSRVLASSPTPSSIHERSVVKEAGLDQLLAYDAHRRVCFADYGLSAMPGLQELIGSGWREHQLWGRRPWELLSRKSGTPSVTLTREQGAQRWKKSIQLRPDGLGVVCDYRLERVAAPVIALEWNLSLQDAQRLEPAWQTDGREAVIRDPHQNLGVRLRWSPGAALATYPIYTVSDSEEGLERTFQGLSLVLLWQLSTEPPSSWSCRIECELIK